VPVHDRFHDFRFHDTGTTSLNIAVDKSTISKESLLEPGRVPVHIFFCPDKEKPHQANLMGFYVL
jgi:hypothetical protein